jgi:hypothetical protein
MQQVTDELITEGVAAFANSYEELIAAIDAKRHALMTA